MSKRFEKGALAVAVTALLGMNACLYGPPPEPVTHRTESGAALPCDEDAVSQSASSTEDSGRTEKDLSQSAIQQDSPSQCPGTMPSSDESTFYQEENIQYSVYGPPPDFGWSKPVSKSENALPMEESFYQSETQAPDLIE